MRIVALHRYPIKGCQGQSLSSCELEARGLQGDRRYMLVNPRGTFCSQRTLPQLGTLQARVTPDGLDLEGQLQVVPSRANPIPVKVWRDRLQAYHQPQADAWLRKRLGTDLRLVYMDKSVDRRTPQDDEVSFADGFPLLLTTTASLDALNEQVQGPKITMAAFRPNLVVASPDPQPWQEDNWKRIRVGELEIELISPCVRCKVTTLDPQDPTKVHPHNEPLSTLRQVRMDPTAKGVTFGWNAVLRSGHGTLKAGDDLQVLAYREQT